MSRKRPFMLHSRSPPEKQQEAGLGEGMLLDAVGLCSVLREPARVLGC